MLRILIVCLFFTANTLLASTISWFHENTGELTLDRLENRMFIPLESELDNGFNNQGNYWFKIVNKSDTENEIIEFEYAHLSEITCYHEGEIVSGLEYRRFPTFLLNKGWDDVYYFKVRCKKEAFIPINSFKEQAYHIQEQNNRMLIGAYYGIAISIFFLHIFYFILFRKKTYIHYAFVLIALGLTLAYRDGLVYLIFGNGWLNSHIEICFNLGVAIFVAMFSSSYLDLHKFVPKYKRVCELVLVLAFSSVLLALFVSEFLFFVIAENMLLVSISLSSMVGAYLFNKNIYSKFFAIAYTPMLLLAYDFYNSHFFGVTITGVNIDLFRLGGVLEMAVFTFAITYQAKEQSKENRLLQNDIEFKNKELTTHTLQFIEKNKLLMDLSTQINELKLSTPSLSKEINSIERKMERSLNAEGDWEEFKLRFENVNTDFYNNILLKYPNLSKAELRLAALVKLQLSVKESATLLNLTERSIITSRSRLRKKLGLSQKDNMFEIVNSF